MNAIRSPQIEYNIARCRVVLSLAAILVVYIDPETPLLASWIPFHSGSFTMDSRLFVVMASHLIYSTVILVGFGRTITPRLAALTTWVDVFFAVAVATMTEGVTSPSYPFFAFAVVSSGLRGGLRQAMRVTSVSLVMYLVLLVITVRGGADVYIMRPVYLAIAGYLAGYLGQQHLELEDQILQLAVAEQRHRIARELHDGYAQALAGINLRLEGARRLLKTGEVAETLIDLGELQDSVKHEYDDLRRYARVLAGVEPTPSLAEQEDGLAELRIHADVSGSVELIDHVLGIAREGISNVRRHARARRARVEIYSNPTGVQIDIADDGVGFRDTVTPWSITSRVKEIGGEIHIVSEQRPGAHLSITLPQG